jgi:signal transduction histidine kinase
LISRVIPPEGIDNALHKIERNVQAQTRLVEDLLEISRFTTGKFRLDRLPVDLVVVANQAIEAIRPSAEARRITIERQFDASSAPMNGDPDRLQQVIWNLLSNAVKFSASESRVVVTLRIIAGVCELGVQDTGIGIDPAFLGFVFEPFRQADASSTRAHGGLGLGLSIVHDQSGERGNRTRRHVHHPAASHLHTGRIATASSGRRTMVRFRRLDRPQGPGGR